MEERKCFSEGVVRNENPVEVDIEVEPQADESDLASEIRAFSDRHGVSLSVAERIIGVVTASNQDTGVRFKSEMR